MNSAAFQAAFVRLVTDQHFREAVRRGELPESILAPTDREQLAFLAAQPGIAAMRVVYRGFRLNKILAMLPLVGRLLGDECLGAELDRFWKEKPSGSFYYFEEADRFCDFLWTRIENGLDVACLRDVLLYEQASMRLQKATAEGRDLMLQVDLEHNPSFLEALREGRLPEELTPQPTSLLGVASEAASIRWFQLNPDTPLPLSAL